jgi:competence protein ComEC
LVPVLFAFIPGAGVLPVWFGVLGGGFLAGSMEADFRRSRPVAEAGRSYSVAVPHVWKGAAILRITGWPTPAANDRWRSPACIVDFESGESTGLLPDVEAGQGLMVSGEGCPPPTGSLVRGFLELSPPPSAPLPGAFDYRQFLAGRDLLWKGRLSQSETLPIEDILTRLFRWGLNPLRDELVVRIQNMLPGKEADMACAVLLGIRDRESRRASRPFSDLGLAHLFAVSGLHVGILLGILLLPSKLAGSGPWVRVMPFFVLLPTYVLLTGMPGSVVRAAALGFLALFAGAMGKSIQPLRLIGLLFWAGTIWNPLQNLDTGLKLSYLAAGGILAVSSLTNGFKFSGNRAFGPVATGLAVSGAAQWFTLPVVAASFGRISMLSPLANLVAVPLFGLAIWGIVLALGLGYVWPGGSQAIAAVAWFLFRSLAGLAGFLSQASSGFPLALPYPGLGSLVTWVALTVTALWVLYLHGRKLIPCHKALPVVLLILGLGLTVFGPLAWKLKAPSKVIAWQFDVGQGDCGVLVFPDGWSMLIDTGGTYGFHGSGGDGPLTRTVLPFLQRNGCTSLDAVVLTHGHRDHTGGAAALAGMVKVDRWYVSGRAARAVSSVVDTTRIFHPQAGTELHKWEDWVVSVVYPPEYLPHDLDENDCSLVVVLSRAGRDVAVWSGDLELEGEGLMLGTHFAPKDVQVWKAGHHGSNTSGSRGLITRFDPDLILLSCGVGNGYGHPNHGPYLARIDTVTIARTDLQGSVLMEWDSRGRLSWRTMATGIRKISPP